MRKTWRVLSNTLKDFQTRIEISGLQIWGCHGVLKEEKIKPQAFEIDIELTLPQVTQDELSHTVDYRQVIDAVFALNESHSFKLIEAFAHTLATQLLETFKLVCAATIRVKKQPVFPVGTHLKHVCAEVHVRRDDPSPPT
jgi:dihydroneopterin aldolase